ncbi:MAG: SGNH/GDSL hydrolase family protein [Planctomycetota bacterium]|jgi:lysophospholipase L1-like esterase
MRKVVLIGDSIRMGYEPFVREALAGAADVTGSKENGGTSTNVLAHLDEWALSREADVVHVNCGLHDIRRERGGAGTETPLEEYRANVEAVLKGLVDSGARVLWATTTPVIEERHNTVKPFDRLSADVAAYNRAAMDVACGLGVEVDDLFEVVTRSGAGGLLSDDGVHFTKAGYRLLGDAVADAVRATLGV